MLSFLNKLECSFHWESSGFLLEIGKLLNRAQRKYSKSQFWFSLLFNPESLLSTSDQLGETHTEFYKYQVIKT